MKVISLLILDVVVVIVVIVVCMCQLARYMQLIGFIRIKVYSFNCWWLEFRSVDSIW